MALQCKRMDDLSMDTKVIQGKTFPSLVAVPSTFTKLREDDDVDDFLTNWDETR